MYLKKIFITHREKGSGYNYWLLANLAKVNSNHIGYPYWLIPPLYKGVSQLAKILKEIIFRGVFNE
jgi:hypothetical protein